MHEKNAFGISVSMLWSAQTRLRKTGRIEKTTRNAVNKKSIFVTCVSAADNSRNRVRNLILFSANSLKLKITSGFKSNQKSNEIWTFYGSTFPLSSHLKPSLIFFDKQNHFSILYSPWLRRGYNVLSTFAAESIHQCSRSNICFPSPQMIFFFGFISFWSF